MRRYTRHKIRRCADEIGDITDRLAEISEKEALPVGMRRGPRWWQACRSIDKAVIGLIEANKLLRSVK